jgi:2',3'-cyclic-nucleotide 2'-phosphodiesterase / 3'-nucleotidase
VRRPSESAREPTVVKNQMKIRTQIGRLIRTLGIAALCWALLGPCVSVLAQDDAKPAATARASRQTITLLSTTDIHGHIEPIDYYSNKASNFSLAKIATLVKEQRVEAPKLLLLDCGDTTQGTPLAYYFAVKDLKPKNPTIAAFNEMHYDAMAVGNHEFNFGLAEMWKAKRESNFPWLAANLKEIYTAGDGFIRPYIIKNVGGVRVGIVGFVTPGVPRWEIPEHYRGYEFEPIVDAAKRVIPLVRKQVDLLVVIMHSGLDRDPVSGKIFEAQDIRGENAAWELAEQVPGIDLIFYGHTHSEMAELTVNGVLMAQAKNWGGSLARADIVMERDAAGPWRVASKHSRVIKTTDSVAADPAILKLAAPYEAATEKYLGTPIAVSEKPMDGERGRYEDDPLVDLIHRVQLEAGHADVSMATMFYTGVQIPKGPVTVRQAAALYVYDNSLYTVDMTGAQLKDALEHAAGFYPAWPAAAGAPLKLPGYNADSAKGVTYEIDLTKPVGARVLNLNFRGTPLAPEQKLRVAINNYRYTGGGGYSVYKGLPILESPGVEIRDLLIDYLTRVGKIPSDADRNWRIVPAEAVAAMEKQAREEVVDRTR